MINNKGIQFSKASTAGNSVKVFTKTPADYRQLVILLDSMKRPFFTYQLKEDKLDQRVIRGLTREMSTEDIREDLVSQGIADAEVQQMKRRKRDRPSPANATSGTGTRSETAVSLNGASSVVRTTTAPTAVCRRRQQVFRNSIKT
ncbi:unnamed protein product [Acanthoscelides obtectus]|uniref:Uncharacterized protein n=1 Tax=Acanthoscelides obtectus TaxID=200917 RepID=A0A9P0LG85_ACAOB|nr:unnamed protein product [Acanthoscelides obtectus]CAK1632909.1 hypothetical protein AOBTE_LOCUS7809 [Acanthoscelides obtectus]